MFGACDLMGGNSTIVWWTANLDHFLSSNIIKQSAAFHNSQAQTICVPPPRPSYYAKPHIKLPVFKSVIESNQKKGRLLRVRIGGSRL